MPDKRSDRESKYNEPLADEIVDRIVEDPGNPEVRRLTGFLLGKSDREGYWRLYLTVDLNHYLEFRKEDTLHAQQFRQGRTVVWLKPEARVTEKLTKSTTVEFLRGNMMGDYIRRHGASFVGMVGSGLKMMAGETNGSCPTPAFGCDGSGCAHGGCSAGCTPGYGCGGDTIGYTCGC
jgi:hypothetical protein